VRDTAYDVYVEGYPRSGNTFCRMAFSLANPQARVRAHRHIPAYVLRAVEADKPGFVLLRDPADAAASWSLFTGAPLAEALTYYIDYYAVLLPVRSELLVVPFEELIRDFGPAVVALNARWGTDFLPFEHTSENVERCMRLLDNAARATDGSVQEARTSRPSHARKLRRQRLLDASRGSTLARDLLAEAGELGAQFRAGA
jgi:hypothetical protein